MQVASSGCRRQWTHMCGLDDRGPCCDDRSSNSWLDSGHEGVATADIEAASGLRRGCGLMVRRCRTGVKDGLI
ncbi:hypothetical protein ACLOJK_015174 [Asimina triloba]